jgi:TolA-binding protein
MVPVKRASAVGGLLALIAFWVGTPCFAEDLSKEVEQLRATVHTLTERVQKQEQQIDALEKTLKGLTSLRKTESDTARSREKKGHTLDEILSEHENSLSKKPLKSWKLKGWKNPSNWTKLKFGMTRSGVQTRNSRGRVAASA